MALLYKKDSIAYEDAVTALLLDELTNKDSNEFIRVHKGSEQHLICGDIRRVQR